MGRSLLVFRRSSGAAGGLRRRAHGASRGQGDGARQAAMAPVESDRRVVEANQLAQLRLRLRRMLAVRTVRMQLANPPAIGGLELFERTVGPKAELRI